MTITLKNFAAELGRLFLFRKRHRILIRHVPEAISGQAINPGTLYVISTAGHLKWAQLSCPCGCGEVIAQPKMERREHVFRLTYNYTVSLADRRLQESFFSAVRKD